MPAKELVTSINVLLQSFVPVFWMQQGCIFIKQNARNIINLGSVWFRGSNGMGWDGPGIRGVWMRGQPEAGRSRDRIFGLDPGRLFPTKLRGRGQPKWDEHWRGRRRREKVHSLTNDAWERMGGRTGACERMRGRTMTHKGARRRRNPTGASTPPRGPPRGRAPPPRGPPRGRA